MVGPRPTSPFGPLEDHLANNLSLSQSASALLNVKAFNLSIKVHQNGASADNQLPSSTLEQLVHLSFMLHAYREWLHRQMSLLEGRTSPCGWKPYWILQGT